MPQIFRPRSNTLGRLALLVALLLPVLLVWLASSWLHSPYARGVGEPVPQPVAFSHELHVGQLGTDCRYCHNTAWRSSYAGMPTTETCMNCHSQVARNSPLLETVLASYDSGEPLAWERVHQLPDSVYFDHSIHVTKGIGCESCHGRVDQMPLTWQSEAMTMEWCLECHREPAPHLRPADEILTMGWAPPGDEAIDGRALIVGYHIQRGQLTDCSVCHR